MLQHAIEMDAVSPLYFLFGWDRCRTWGMLLFLFSIINLVIFITIHILKPAFYIVEWFHIWGISRWHEQTVNMQFMEYSHVRCCATCWHKMIFSSVVILYWKRILTWWFHCLQKHICNMHKITCFFVHQWFLLKCFLVTFIEFYKGMEWNGTIKNGKERVEWIKSIFFFWMF